MELTQYRWRKSSYSAANGGDCIEVADLPTAIGVRDSKDPDGPQLHIPHDAFKQLTKAIKNL
ncbi:DUF397 domain-containing protein [Actinomadura rugatobispora]|uniref:DUF397 domain-containing protein n=1 Tax=Actinomadura rugatobispora TaxID=1994 RepID=A0ABW0ZVZ1_9ACTN|nr:hypothetical protein GCM10010200_051210 [Actinomadura rugatobispora]